MFEKLRQNQVKIPIKIFMGFLRARAVPRGDSKNLARFFKLVEKFAKIKFKNFLILFLCIPYIGGIQNFLHKKMTAIPSLILNVLFQCDVLQIGVNLV